MPTGYDYRCDACDHNWMLFSTRLTLGPTQWGHIRYTCFSCQTFLTVAKSVDRNSWSIWQRNNQQSLDESVFLTQLVARVDQQLATVKRLTPIELNFNAITCPTCRNDQMRDIPFGGNPMRCPHCHEFTGKHINNDSISNYAEIDPHEELDK